MLSSPFFRQGIAELACKQGKNSNEAKEFSEGYACISCFRAVSRYVMQISACEQLSFLYHSPWKCLEKTAETVCHFNPFQLLQMQ